MPTFGRNKTKTCAYVLLWFSLGVKGHAPGFSGDLNGAKRQTGGMISWIRIGIGLGALGATLVLAACGGGDVDPEVRHCETAFGRVTKDVRERAIVDTRVWAVGDDKNIAITYDGIYGQADTALRDVFKCTYYAPVGTTRGGSARIDATAIMVRGKRMSEAELLLVNTAIHMQKPKLLP